MAHDLRADLDQLLAHRGHRPVLHLLGWRQFPLMAEGVEELLNNPFSAEIGEHCRIAEFLSY